MNSRVLNYLAFAVLLATTALGWTWPWGILFVVWVLPSYLTGEVHLVGVIKRTKDPILFWAITLLWAAFGVFMILEDLAPSFAQKYLQ